MTAVKGRSLLVLGLVWLAGCTRNMPTLNPTARARPTPPVEKLMVQSAQIVDTLFDRAFYEPGASVHLTVRIRSEADEPTLARLSALINHLADRVGQLQQDIILTRGDQLVELVWSPPPDSPRGYGVDLQLETAEGTRLASASTAFDVLERWTQSPRYGFLTDFSPGRSDAAETMAILTRYHINGLQFYDWMYRHEQFLTEKDPYRDLLGRELSRKTVDALIAEAHKRGIAAMPYTAVYGASLAFYKEHPDWALLKAGGQPAFFGENFMVLMDPRPASPWTAHLLDQFDQVLQQTEFDGIHLDQYGDPKEGYDAEGHKYDLAGPLAEFINAARSYVDARRLDGAVVFNAVTNWPIEAAAPAPQDLVYIEVWPPYRWFADLHQLIVQAQALGHGKPVVLAAYLNPAWEQNVRLIDAVIFASGGGHIELGEQAGMLADPYFPKYGVMSFELAERIRRYYDFAVRYQDVIGPRTQDATQNYQQHVRVVGVSTAPNLRHDKVWPLVREGVGFTAISLINLLGLENAEWNQLIATAPTPLGAMTVQITGVERTAARVWLATPDGTDSAPQSLAFTQENSTLSFEIHSLLYWDLIVVEWSK